MRAIKVSILEANLPPGEFSRGISQSDGKSHEPPYEGTQTSVKHIF